MKSTQILFGVVFVVLTRTLVVSGQIYSFSSSSSGGSVSSSSSSTGGNYPSYTGGTFAGSSASSSSYTGNPAASYGSISSPGNPAASYASISSPGNPAASYESISSPGNPAEARSYASRSSAVNTAPGSYPSSRNTGYPAIRSYPSGISTGDSDSAYTVGRSYTISTVSETGQGSSPYNGGSPGSSVYPTSSSSMATSSGYPVKGSTVYGGSDTSSWSSTSSDSGASGSSSSSASSETEPSDPCAEHKSNKIVCLYHNKQEKWSGLTPDKIDPRICTHINYQFGKLNPKTLELESSEPNLDIDKKFYEKTVALKEKSCRLRVWLSIGGWADSTKKYSELAASEEKRKNFAQKAKAFLLKYNFDGLDFAWEYPNCWQGAIGAQPKDKENYVKLLEELKNAFKGSPLQVSVSGSPIEREVEAGFAVREISNLVDQINIMTYDMHGPWEPNAWHHAQLKASRNDVDKSCNVESVLKFWKDKGANRTKLVMGIPMYSKTFTLQDSQKNQIGAKVKGPGKAGKYTNEDGFLAYSEVCELLTKENWTEKDDKEVGFYAYKGDQWICYDPPMMVVKKVKYAIDFKYGGVMLKDIACDDWKGECYRMAFPLTKMAYMEMQRLTNKTHPAKGKGST